MIDKKQSELIQDRTEYFIQNSTHETGQVRNKKRITGEHRELMMPVFVKAAHFRCYVTAVIVFFPTLSAGIPYFMNQTNGTKAWCLSTNCLGKLSYSLVVGESLSFNLTAINLQSRSSTILINVITDPGLPNGAQLSAILTMAVQVACRNCVSCHVLICVFVFLQANFLNMTAKPKETWVVTYRTFSFTPQPRQEGLRYKAIYYMLLSLSSYFSLLARTLSPRVI